MQYIRPTPNPSGAYPAPQSNPAPGLVPISDTLTAELVAYNGFVLPVIENGEVVSLAVNTEAWEAWKAAETAKEALESGPTPTDSERLAAMEAAILELAEVIANG